MSAVYRGESARSSTCKIKVEFYWTVTLGIVKSIKEEFKIIFFGVNENSLLQISSFSNFHLLIIVLWIKSKSISVWKTIISNEILLISAVVIKSASPAIRAITFLDVQWIWDSNKILMRIYQTVHCAHSLSRTEVKVIYVKEGVSKLQSIFMDIRAESFFIKLFKREEVPFWSSEIF